MTGVESVEADATPPAEFPTQPGVSPFSNTDAASAPPAAANQQAPPAAATGGGSDAGAGPSSGATAAPDTSDTASSACECPGSALSDSV